MNNQVTKALQTAAQVLKGSKPNVTVAELEIAMVTLGDLHKRDGEDAAACFARLVAERNADVETLAKAIDTVRAAKPQRSFTKALAQTNGLLDRHVELNKRDGESTAAAFARLSRDADFQKLYERLRSVQRQL